jgi:hypothetical protein
VMPERLAELVTDLGLEVEQCRNFLRVVCFHLAKGLQPDSSAPPVTPREARRP